MCYSDLSHEKARKSAPSCNVVLHPITYQMLMGIGPFQSTDAQSRAPVEIYAQLHGIALETWDRI